MAFARRFGELEVHPFLSSNTGEPELVRFEKTAEVSGYENSWHHDVTWRACPSMGAILHAVAVPDAGGDTLFSDMYAAYDGLDQATKDEIDELQAVHDFTQTFGHAMSAEERTAGPGAVPARAPSRGVHAPRHRATPPLRQPPLREPHRRYWTASPAWRLLDRLCRQADAPEHQCRFTWTKDAVAFWDNRAVQHYASSDYWPQRRSMERASVIGTAPARA